MTGSNSTVANLEAAWLGPLPSAPKTRLVIDNPFCGVVIIGQDQRIRFANSMAARLLGLPADAAVGSEYRAALVPGQVTETVTCLAEGEWVTVEQRVAETVWDGEPALLISLQDITSRKHAELLLRENEARFRTVLESSAIGISVDTFEGRPILANPALQNMLGYTEDELRGMVYTEFTYPEDRAPEARLYQELLAGQRDSYQFEKRYIRKDGQVIWGGLTVSLLRQSDQPPTHFVALVEDITERKRTKDELSQSEERWRSLAENAPDVILTVECSGKIRYANRSFQGTPADRLIGRPLYACVLLEHRNELRLIFDRVVQTGQPAKYEFSGIAEANGLSWHIAHIAPIVVEARIVGATVLISDISERKRMEDALRDYARCLEERVTDRTRKLSVLYQVTAATSEVYDLKAMLANALESVLATIPGSAGCVQLLDEESCSKVLVVGHGLSAAKEIAAELDQGFGIDSPWTRVLREGLSLRMTKGNAERRLTQTIQREGFQAYLGVPIRASGQTVGVLSVFLRNEPRLTIDDVEVLSSVAGQLGRAVERIELRRQAEHTIVVEERQRLARDLHDSITQLLCSQALLAEASRKFVEAGEATAAAPYLSQLVETAHQALKEMRLMIYDLRPSALEKEGLVRALQCRLEAVEQRAGIQTSLVGCISTPLSRQEEEGLYRIAQELLNNVLRHAEASSVTITLRDQTSGRGEAHVELEVADNGKGFAPDAPSAGIGLKSIQERVERLGGTLSIASRINQGCRVTISLQPRARSRESELGQRPRNRRVAEVR